MKFCPIFISSADSYSDLWPLFFDLFVKYWPEYKGTIYLNTELLDYKNDRLDIQCTKVGRLGSFGKTFRAGLDKIESPYVLLIMIDYLFMGKVDHEKLREYFRYFKEKDLDSLCLIKQEYDQVQSLQIDALYLVVPPSKDMFSYQIAFWKKESLYDMALPSETPWLSEWYGTLRANLSQIKLAYTDLEVIPYLAEGALHKGKWVDTMVNFLQREQMNVNYSQRGYFVDVPASVVDRVKGRIKTFVPRCLSNIDLWKRKYKKRNNADSIKKS